MQYLVPQQCSGVFLGGVGGINTALVSCDSWFQQKLHQHCAACVEHSDLGKLSWHDLSSVSDYPGLGGLLLPAT
jgi:hypothetical protein